MTNHSVRRFNGTWLAMFAVIVVLAASAVIGLRGCDTSTARFQPDQTQDPFEVVQNAATHCKRADRKSLQSLLTSSAWKRLSDTYDWQRSAEGYEGTFDDYLRMLGETIAYSDPKKTQRRGLKSGGQVFVIRRHPETLTIAIRRESGRWKIAFLSPGEIDPDFVDAESQK